MPDATGESTTEGGLSELVLRSRQNFKGHFVGKATVQRTAAHYGLGSITRVRAGVRGAATSLWDSNTLEVQNLLRRLELDNSSAIMRSQTF
jgi:hypothetical protein